MRLPWLLPSAPCILPSTGMPGRSMDIPIDQLQSYTIFIVVPC